MNNTVSEEQYVTFKLGNEYYGVNINYVKTIEKVSQFTRVPNAPDFIKGVINLRGEVVVVMDLSKRMNLDPIEINSETRIIIVSKDDLILGLLVDSSSEVVQISKKDIDNPPNINGSISNVFIQGIGKKDGRMIIILNLLKILEIG